MSDTESGVPDTVVAMKRIGGRPRLMGRLVACVALGVVMVSCGDDDSASTATTAAAAGSSATEGSAAPSGDVCADREALSTSVDALTDVDVVAEGTDGVTAAVSDVKDDLAALSSSAGADLQPEVQSVQDAVDEVETAVADLDSGGAEAAVTALADLATSAQTLLASLEASGC